MLVSPGNTHPRSCCVDEPRPAASVSATQSRDETVYLHEGLPRPIKILLVEDDSVQIHIVTAALAELPQLDLLAVASDGSEAVAFLRHRLQNADGSLPDVILLDLNMPNMDGFGVLAELKSVPLLRRIPTVVFSTSDDQEDIDRAYEEGANSYVVKPAKLNDLKRSLDLVASYWAKAARLPTHVVRHA